MINFREILRLIGFLLVFLSFSMIVLPIVATLNNETDLSIYIKPILITFFSGLIMFLVNIKQQKDLTRRDGFIVVFLIWILFSVFGALPYYFSGKFNTIADCFFESVSGFTTTGATIISNVEGLQPGINFWRHFTHFLGGMGIIVFSLALLPILGTSCLQLQSAESSNLVANKIFPKIKEVAIKLWLLYVILTIIQAILLWFFGMTVFDALCHSFSAMGSGGFSTKNLSIAYYNTPEYSVGIQYTLIFFMIVTGINYAVLYLFVLGKIFEILKKTEFLWYLSIIGIATALCFIGLMLNGRSNIEETFRVSLFEVSTMISCTGFGVDDYIHWPQALIFIIVMITMIGGCSGSTAGGLKVMRFRFFIKNIIAEFKKLIHPNAVFPVRIDGVPATPKTVNNILAFALAYIMIIFAGATIISIGKENFETSIGVVISCFSNCGPALGKAGPMGNCADFSIFNKIFLSFIMLIGRLEIFTFFIIFTPYFWKR